MGASPWIRSSVVVFALTSAMACGDNQRPPLQPDACAPTTWYADADGDGHGDPAAPRRACSAPPGFVDDATDCDDGAATVFPSAAETCGDGIDQDCAGGDPLCSAARDGWTLTAGRVVAAATPDLITATVTFAKVSGTATTRGGGACLVADLVARGIGAATCVTDDDCVAARTAFPNGYAYCASPDGSGEPKRCWTRPGDLCVRSPANPEGGRALPAVPWNVGGANTPVRWLLLGCLAEEATPTACGGTDPSKYVRSIGPATTFGP